MRRVFVSYRSLDAENAKALADCIKSVGAECYLDQRDPSLESIGAGAVRRRTPVLNAIRSGLRGADTLVAVITRLARGSWWVPAEIAIAHEMSKEVVAICETDVRPPDFAIHHLILEEQHLRQWLRGLGDRPVDEIRLGDFSRELFKPASDALRTASEEAVQRIEALWKPATWKDLVLEDRLYAHRGDWIGCTSATLIRTLRAMVIPVYLWRQPRFDRSELEREVASALVDSWIDEESLAALDPRVLYEARKPPNWRTLRDQEPARYWLQGMKLKDIDALFSEIACKDGSPLSEAAFKQLFLERARTGGEVQKPLGLAANALQGFTLSGRPVFARVLAVHLRIHHALLRLDLAGGIGRMTPDELLALPSRSRVEGTVEGDVSLAYLMRKRRARLQPLLWNDAVTR
jgi:hypothetical protein